MTTPSNSQETLRLVLESIPAGWFSTRKGSSLWITGYQAFHVDEQLDAKAAIRMPLGDVRATLIRGSITYFDPGIIKVTFPNDVVTFEATGAAFTTTPIATYLLLVSPYGRNGVPGSEQITQTRISEAVALLATVFGRNIAFRRLFDNIFDLENQNISAPSPVIENPAWFPAVSPSQARLTLVDQLISNHGKKDELDRSRIQLALRWHEQAMFATGTDAFLKHWIAIETLTMPDETHIRPLEMLLASAYGFDESTAREKFQIGRIFGLRSRIVHKGELIPIHSELLRYMDAIFVDALYALLGAPIEQRALGLFTNPDFKLKNYLRKTNSGS